MRSRSRAATWFGSERGAEVPPIYENSAAAGWMPPLPPAAKAEISRRWPAVAVNGLERAFGYYIVQRDAEVPPPEAQRETARSLRAAIAKARKLAAEYERLPVPRAALEQWAAQRGHPDALGQMLRAMHVVERGVASTARQALPRGNPRNPRRDLALALAALVTGAGLRADARPGGALCGLLGVLLEAAGEAPSSLPAIARLGVGRPAR